MDKLESFVSKPWQFIEKEEKVGRFMVYEKDAFVYENN